MSILQMFVNYFTIYSFVLHAILQPHHHPLTYHASPTEKPICPLRTSVLSFTASSNLDHKGLCMTRITNVDGTPAAQRNRLRRTIAEILRRLGSKTTVDTETKDMLAFIITALRLIEASIEKSCEAWEKRDYYLKADQFRREWTWLAPTADRLEDLLVTEEWSLLPTELAGLAARFLDVKVNQMTKPASLWQGAYQKLLSNPNGKR